MNKVNKLITLLKEDGAAYVLYKVKKKLQTKLGLKRQEASLVLESIPMDVKFSIVVPLFNTPERLLREMMDSVAAQSYSNWELCMADGSDDTHGYVGELVQAYVQRDERFKYRKLRENMGISGNTNACIEMATGDYIALFDHDDLLHPHALYEAAKAIYNEGADFIYTDETMFYESPEDAYSPHYKPDFAPDTLRSYNYITHLSVFSRTLMDKVGLFRSEFDGSQDYDMILRLTEQAEKIVHIPKILYYWRNHPGSVASDVSVKPYTMVSARKALAEHLERVGLKGVVEDSSVPTTYRIRYEIQGTPLVSIVFDEHPLCECVEAIRKITSYPNYEIVTDGQVNGEYVLFLSDFVRPTTT
ncbi:MAG: glycosyltransferase, partial [Oscillospiraceae bacterium]|nr:glycosyltransferase [Oscillospiraceae bacterium]